MSTEPREVFDTEQAADFVGATPRWVRDQVRSGELPAARLGKQLRIMRSDLISLLRKHPSHVRGRPVTGSGSRMRRPPLHPQTTPELPDDAA